MKETPMGAQPVRNNFGEKGGGGGVGGQSRQAQCAAQREWLCTLSSSSLPCCVVQQCTVGRTRRMPPPLRARSRYRRLWHLHYTVLPEYCLSFSSSLHTPWALLARTLSVAQSDNGPFWWICAKCSVLKRPFIKDVYHFCWLPVYNSFWSFAWFKDTWFLLLNFFWLLFLSRF